MKILLLHGYSPNNRGDGLLVSESVALVREAFGDEVELTLATSRPRDPWDFPGRIVSSHPRELVRPSGLWRDYRKNKPYDLIVGVGGGYLRSGDWRSTMRMNGVHIPQVVLAAFSRTATIYLPQSIGPYPPLLRRGLEMLLRRMSVVYVRDDRSLYEMSGVKTLARNSDLALSAREQRRKSGPLAPLVMSVRPLSGIIPTPVLELKRELGTVLGFVQSVGGSNEDTDAVRAIAPAGYVDAAELENGKPRVVIAMRLHAALMALNNGHYVIHLAYERKGWGAFEDLNLHNYVFNCRSFDPAQVLERIAELEGDARVRGDYDERVQNGWQLARKRRLGVVEALRAFAGQQR